MWFHIILDTPSFVISRTPGFGYPLREGIDVSLKCDVDSNPPSTPLWQKDDGDTPVNNNSSDLSFLSIRDSFFSSYFFFFTFIFPFAFDALYWLYFSGFLRNIPFI